MAATTLTKLSFALLLSCVHFGSVRSASDDSHDSHDSHSHDSHDDDEHGDEDCPCSAEEYGFEIKCVTETITAAYDSWYEKDCNDTAKSSCSDECQKIFYIVQTHHDYCSDELLDSEVLVGFHDLEESKCEECHIGKQYNPNLDSCPTVMCDNKDDSDAQVAALSMYNCDTNCSSTACESAYQYVRAYHDTCEDGDEALTEELEEGIHDYEDACSMNECNSADGPQNLTCTEDHGGEGSGANGIYNYNIMSLNVIIVGSLALLSSFIGQ